MQRTRLIMALVAVTASFSTLTQGEIQSLTSGEMTDTYVKDSTIIVTPTRQPEKPRQVVTYSISPGEPVKSDAEIQRERDRALEEARNAADAATAAAFEVDDKFALNPVPTVQFPELIPREPPPFGIQVPEGPYQLQDLIGVSTPDAMPYGDQLNSSFDGQQYILTIGNIPGYNPVNLDQSYQGQYLELRPLDTGGFQIVIDPAAAQR